VILLPWPHAKLNPNARAHWGERAKRSRTARKAAYYLAKVAGASAPASGPVNLLIKFYPPDNRGRDMDNAIAALKPSLDGLADAMKVNDNRFRPTFEWCASTKPGRVEIFIGGQ
jgi:crossover junction endodeoxyribonuclease RusA